jgi:hypothetical protein
VLEDIARRAGFRQQIAAPLLLLDGRRRRLWPKNI